VMIEKNKGHVRHLHLPIWGWRPWCGLIVCFQVVLVSHFWKSTRWLRLSPWPGVRVEPTGDCYWLVIFQLGNFCTVEMMIFLPLSMNFPRSPEYSAWPDLGELFDSRLNPLVEKPPIDDDKDRIEHIFLVIAQADWLMRERLSRRMNCFFSAVRVEFWLCCLWGYLISACCPNA
jgi:hypothetical protein